MHEMSNKHDNFSNFGSAIERISCTSTAPARQQRCAEVHKVSFELSHLRKRSTALVVILCDLMSLQLLCSMSCTSASRNMHDYYTAHQCSTPCRKVCVDAMQIGLNLQASATLVLVLLFGGHAGTWRGGIRNQHMLEKHAHSLELFDNILNLSP